MRHWFTIRMLAVGIATSPLAMLSASALAADDFPVDPIEIAVHTSPGGGTDTTARMVALSTQEQLDSNVFVQNKKGGGGSVAMSYVSGKPADGYTLMAITPTHLFTMLRGNAPIGIDDIRGVVRATDDPIIVMVRGDSDYASIDDLIEAGRSGTIKWGGTQIGGVDHIAAMSFANEADIRVSYVPFDSGAEFAAALSRGDIDAAGLNISETQDQIADGEFRPLAVMADERMGALPEVPTLAENGMDVSFSTVRGYVVLKDTPQERVDALEQAMLDGMQSERYQEYLDGIGLDSASVAGSEAWDQQIRRMYEAGKVTMTDLGLLQ
ncbi:MULTISPECIES: tripartite tricarboxylate transporter substrate binding protein [unclassified Halomonas]|uniref:Tripartite tricarboxylate transporter substrate binding protein n=1 Tax=Halomonas sp. RT37 TaxID=2950872 RepID=A0AAU7KHY7_9GAMM|nr:MULTISPECIES: tripartite tricarboxylate transporter substrate binding protein [unclassified Halomonas]MAR73212.1 transporter [Halomonas sp.]MBR9879976.1 tripartite tricarboxylate transporter substrate binding protein [Gammaproteobacteria bacterium]|tara:strand:+ start:1846 stop:2817 length:972 start_codon:yes stop_codon:yes gene_type:complete